MQKILVLGGTQFIGRNLVMRLQEMNEFDITLFNRQQTQADLFPDINKIKGDRKTDDIKQIAKKEWDYVIDLSCYYPDDVVRTLSQLLKSTKKYIFISTSSVYDNENDKSTLRTEIAETLKCNSQQNSDQTTSSYGNRKAECERILIASGMNYTILRPCLVYGDYDYTDRLYYWIHQVKQNVTLVLPDNGERIFSLTYVHDLVESIVKAIRSPQTSGIYNVISTPKASIKLITTCICELMNKEINVLNATPDFLRENKISEWTDMPLWIDGDYCTYSNDRIKRDFAFKPTGLKESIKNTISYHNGLGWHQPKYGISEARRQELLNQLMN